MWKNLTPPKVSVPYASFSSICSDGVDSPVVVYSCSGSCSLILARTMVKLAGTLTWDNHY